MSISTTLALLCLVIIPLFDVLSWVGWLYFQLASQAKAEDPLTNKLAPKNRRANCMNKSFEGGICLFFTRPATESRVFSGVSDSNLVKTMKAAVPESTQISHIEIVNKIIEKSVIHELTPTSQSLVGIDLRVIDPTRPPAPPAPACGTASHGGRLRR